MFFFLVAGSASSALLSAAFDRQAILTSQNRRIGWLPGAGFILSFGCAALLDTMAAIQPIVVKDSSIMEAQQKYLVGREKPLAEFCNPSIQVGSN